MRRALVCLVITTTPAFAKDVVTPTGKLDFELVQRGDAYVLRDEAYSITFAGKPTVDLLPFKFENEDFPAVSALLTSPTDAVGFSVKPMPKHWTGAAAVVLDDMRDGFVQGAKATLTKQTPITLGGLDGRHISAVKTEAGQRVFLEADLLWDRKHRVVVGVLTTNTTGKRTPEEQAFVSSFSVRGDARGPLDEPPPAEGVATKLGMLGLEVVRHGSKYVVRDGIIEATFPSRPVLRTYATSPDIIIGVTQSSEEIETLGVTVLQVPDGQDYDPVVGLAGARDGLLKQFTNEHHTETKTTVGGLQGRRLEVTGTLFGVPAHGDIRIVWDAKHRRLFGVMASTATAKLPASARAFLDSFAINTH